MAFGLEGLAGAIYNRYPGQKRARKEMMTQYELQKMFATHGIRWKVEDARLAGIHPLAALGAQTHSYMPQMVGDGEAQGRAVGRAAGGAAEGIKTAIQYATGASGKRQTEQQDSALRQMLLSEEGLGLDNEWKRLRNISLQQESIDKASPNQGTNQRVMVKPDESKHSTKANVGLSAAAISVDKVGVNKMGRISFELQQEIGESRESATGPARAQMAILDAYEIAQLARDPVKRFEIRKAVIESLKRSNKMPKGHGVEWVPSMNSFYLTKSKPYRYNRSGNVKVQFTPKHPAAAHYQKTYGK